jgi:hypothetical protein
VRDFWERKVMCKLGFNKDRSALEATIGIFLKDGRVVTARVLTAVEHS